MNKHYFKNKINEHALLSMSPPPAHYLLGSELLNHDILKGWISEMPIFIDSPAKSF